MKNKKQFIINVIAQILAFVINAGIGFLLTPYIIKTVGVEANGFVSLANDFVQYAQLLTISLNSMAGRFITIRIHKGDDESAIEYFSSVFIANIILSLVLSILFIVIILYLDKFMNISSGIILSVKILWAFIFANFILSIFSSIYSTSTFIKDRLDLSAIANIISYIIRIVILVLTYVIFGLSDVWPVGLSVFCAGLFILIINICYRNKLTKNLVVNKKKFQIKKIKELLFSGIWNTVSKLSSILSSGLSLLITNLFAGGHFMGILSVAKTIPTMILSLFSMISSVFAPQLTLSYAQNDFDGMKKQLISAIKILSLISSIPIALFFVYGKEFYNLWVPNQNTNLLYIVTIIQCIELTFCLVLEPLYNVFTVTNKVKTSALALLLFSILTITTIFIGINIFEQPQTRLFIIIGCSSFYSCIRVLLFLPMYGAKCIKSKITAFYPTILKSIISTICLILTGFLIKICFDATNWFSLFIIAIVMALVGIVINYIIMFNKDERRNIQKKLKIFNKELNA